MGIPRRFARANKNATGPKIPPSIIEPEAAVVMVAMRTTPRVPTWIAPCRNASVSHYPLLFLFILGGTSPRRSPSEMVYNAARADARESLRDGVLREDGREVRYRGIYDNYVFMGRRVATLRSCYFHHRRDPPHVIARSIRSIYRIGDFARARARSRDFSPIPLAKRSRKSRRRIDPRLRILR